MPTIGEIQRANNGGKKQWCACRGCGKERWTLLHAGKPISLRCRQCSPRRGLESPSWKGGRGRCLDYVSIHVAKNDMYYPMVNSNGRVMEHRLVVARSIGRCLLKTEHVHHINGVRDDNRIENLKLLSREDHGTYTHLCSKCELRKEIRLLKWKVMQLERAAQGRLIENQRLA